MFLLILVPFCKNILKCCCRSYLTHSLAHHFAEKFTLKTNSIHLSLLKVKGVISNGTLNTMLNAVQPANIKKTKNVNLLKDPSGNFRLLFYSTIHYLILAPNHRPVQSTYLNYNQHLKKWQSHFVMEAANIRYVARSYSLLKNEYGPNFVYTEGIGHRFF